MCTFLSTEGSAVPAASTEDAPRNLNTQKDNKSNNYSVDEAQYDDVAAPVLLLELSYIFIIYILYYIVMYSSESQDYCKTTNIGRRFI